MFPRIQKSRAVVSLAVEEAFHVPFASDQFIRRRDYALELERAGLVRRFFQVTAGDAHKAFHRQIIFRDEVTGLPRHASGRCRQAGPRFHASLRYVIRDHLALKPLERYRLENRAGTALPKNRFAFAVEDEIAGFG